MIKSITRILTQFRNVTFRVVCLLNDNRPLEGSSYRKKTFRKWITGTTKNRESSITYDYATFLIFDFNDRSKESIFSSKNMFMLPIFQIPFLIWFLKKSFSMFSDEESFYWKTNTELDIYQHGKELTCTSDVFIKNTTLASKLVVIPGYDDKKDMEGLRIFVNSPEYYFDIKKEDVLSLIFILEKTDFFNLSQSLVNSSIIWSSPATINELNASIVTSEEYRDYKSREENILINRINSTPSIQSKKNSIFDDLANTELVNK